MEQPMIKAYYNKENTNTSRLTMIQDSVTSDRIITNLDEFLKAAGRDYYIKKQPVYQKITNGDFAEIENQYHLVRSSDERVISPHTVSDQYAPLSLIDIAEEMKPFIDQGWATPDAVYSAKNESLEMLNLRLDAGGMAMPNGEAWKYYICICNPHASGGKANGKIIGYRPICSNGFFAAVSAVAEIKISHRVAAGDLEVQNQIMSDRTSNAIANWQRVKMIISKMAERINVWSNSKISDKDAAELANRIVGITDIDKATTRAKNKRDAIISAFNMPSAGTYGNSAYDLVNAVTYVNSSPMAAINQKSKVSDIDRMVRNLESNGTGFKFESDALTIVNQFVGIEN